MCKKDNYGLEGLKMPRCLFALGERGLKKVTKHKSGH
jgi:hypothetical protein